MRRPLPPQYSVVLQRRIADPEPPMKLVRIMPPGTLSGATNDDPFDLLEACHERVERMLRLLEKLRIHAGQNGIDGQAADAARDIMRYFDKAAPEHHRDEELHIFPLVRAHGNDTARAVVDRLEREHRLMVSGWQEARIILADTVSPRSAGFSTTEEACLDAFAALYHGHRITEEDLIYPSAKTLLTPRERAAMAGEMMERRGVR